jgi:hypothetical protein
LRTIHDGDLQITYDQEAVLKLARLIGRQMAREAFQKRRDEEADLIRQMAANVREMAEEVPKGSEAHTELLEVAAEYDRLAEQWGRPGTPNASVR